MKNNFILTLLFIVCLSAASFAQLDSVYYLGPAAGNVPSGVTVTLNPMTFDEPSDGEFKIADRNLEEPYLQPSPDDLDLLDSNLPDYVYVEDSNISGSLKGTNAQSIIVNRWPGIPMTNSIPPDPIMAVGPDHVIACANSAFRVWDKVGNLLANINADNWISPVISAGAFDPQIIYDHYSQRWFMLWDWQDSGSQQAWFIICYSDNADPFGTWYMYKMDAKVNGTTNSGTWGDFPQIGYDDQAIYINSRSFSWAGYYQYNKIRILNKSVLYTSNGGVLPFVDLWSIGRPNVPSDKPDVLEPAICYTPGQGGYFFNTLQNGGVYTIMYKLLNPTSPTPRLRGKTLVVNSYGNAPLAQQLGGGMGIESGGSKHRHSPIVRDNFLYAAHSIANTTNASYSSVRYYKIDLNSSSILEQSELGAIGYYFLYPALTIDKNHNIAVTFSRSATSEYCGAYFATKLATDPPGTGLSSSVAIQEGLGNYVVDFGSGRNRWGDYMGIYLDPANELDIWTFTEYAAATNTWGTYVSQIRMEPFSGFFTHIAPNTLDFGDVEVNNDSDELEIVIANYGSDNLIISDIGINIGPFSRTSNHNFPITLVSFDTLIVKIKFSPTTAGDYDEILPVNANDPAITGLHIVGHGYDMYEAVANYFYASSGPNNNGDILTIDMTTGAGTLLGSSLFNEVRRIAVNPLNNIIYGIVTVPGGTGIVRVNAKDGDAYELFRTDLSQVNGIAFDTLGTLYLAQQTGGIYTVDEINQTYSIVTTTNVSINCIAFSSVSNQLWAGLFRAIGSSRDSIFTIDLVTGLASPIGVTGFSIMTNDLTFDKNNNLYGIVGAATGVGKLISINTTNGAGTEIGEVGFNNVVGLAYAINGQIVSMDDKNEFTPQTFSLAQNYPNPFNPSTKISFRVAEPGKVSLKVFDILGNEVMSLVDEQKPAGLYEVKFDASSLTSGVYFYQLKSGNLIQTKKMVLLK